MALYHHGSMSKKLPSRTGMTEFEILKKAHRFLREDDDTNQSWDDQLAAKYYESLYREFAVCDLKHYKSGNFALRWRTEHEVLSGAGETTCANTRCEHHESLPEYLRRSAGPAPPLTTLELPFAYEEHGENKSALVKVVLCPKCFDKLMWKRRKEKGKAIKGEGQEEAGTAGSSGTHELEDKAIKRTMKEESRGERGASSKRYEDDTRRNGDREKRRSSRSRSPRQTNHKRHSSPSHRRERDYRH
ncbi:hypothetical protein H0H92_009407 [Tricholoma furcatifolium]|nr:hypothetical protein H0H92_009407 [Tricholoma furcatifolium]